MARAARRVVHPHAPAALPVLECRFEQVVLDRRRDDRALPLEQRGNGKTGGLSAARGPDDGEARLRFGSEEAAGPTAERQATRDRYAYCEAADVGPPREPGVGADAESGRLPLAVSTDEPSRHHTGEGQNRERNQLRGPVQPRSREYVRPRRWPCR